MPWSCPQNNEIRKSMDATHAFSFLVFGHTGSFSSCVEWGLLFLQCGGFSLLRPLLFWSTGSRHTGFCSCGSRALERGLSSCGTWAQLLRGICSLPRPGIKCMSLALAGGFLSIGPPGMSHPQFLKYFR